MTAVVMVSGSWPPEACGVGDYTERLCRALEESGISVNRFHDPRLSQLYARGTIDRVANVACDLVHIQYPTAGYGRSCIPAALPSAVRDKPVIVTLHEYSIFRWYRRPWFSPYARRGAARILPPMKSGVCSNDASRIVPASTRPSRLQAISRRHSRSPREIEPASFHSG